MSGPVLTRAHRAVFGIFGLAGLAFSAWASRIPDAKVELGLSAGRLGTVLLFLSAGSLIALPSAGGHGVLPVMVAPSGTAGSFAAARVVADSGWYG